MSKHPAEVELCCKSKAGSASEGVGKNGPAGLMDVHLVWDLAPLTFSRIAEQESLTLVCPSVHLNNPSYRDTEKRLMDSARAGCKGTNGQSSTEMYITMCKIDSQWEVAV